MPFEFKAPTNSDNLNPIDILGHIDEINEDDINKLRQKIDPLYLETFDHMSEDDKHKLTLFYALPKNTLKALVEKGGHIPGIHNADNLISQLAQMTNDPKFHTFH